MTENDSIKEDFNIENCLEALLFAASSPVTLTQLAEAIEVTPNAVKKGLQALEEKYNQNSGLKLQWYSGKVQMTTSPEYAVKIERFLGLEATSKLTRAALEALAIIAYKQPVTRPGVDAVRGVNSDGVVRSLLNKGLIEEVGRQEGPGRPILYGTTPDFLQHFGLSSLEELPELEIDEPDTDEESNKLLKD